MDKSNSSVLMIGWEYPPHNSGGLGVACDGLTRALSEQNTQIYFTLPYSFSSSLSHMQMIECAHPTWSQSPTQPPFSSYAAMPVAAPQSSDFAASELVDFRVPGSVMEQRVQEYADRVVQQTHAVHDSVQLIHAHDWMSYPAAQQLKSETGYPLIAHIHSTEYDRIPSGLGSSFIIETEQAGFEAADHIIAVSLYTKHLLMNKYGISGSKISVVHNGISPLGDDLLAPKLSFATDQPVVVFMGRLTMQKGGEYFLRVASQVSRRLPNALFVVAGDGDLYKQLLFTVAREQLTAKVLFTGFVRDKQQAQLLDRADVFIMPSLSEPFGIVALEAAQRQTPVIISKQSGVAEVLPSAIKIDFWDVDAISRTVIELLENRQQRQLQVAGQNQELQATTWDLAAERVKKIYQVFLGR